MWGLWAAGKPLRAFSFRPKQATAAETKLDISLKNQFQLARKAEFGLFQKTQNVRKTYVAYVGRIRSMVCPAKTSDGC